MTVKRGIDIEALKAAQEMYTAQLDDQSHEERYWTERMFADSELDAFLQWLEEQPDP